MMHQSIATIDSPEFINLQPLEINPLMSSCEIKVLYLGQNRNHSYITKDVATEMAKTLRGAPIVGYYREDKEDFRDHGEKVIFDDEGVKFECLTKPYGFVAPDAKVWFQKFEDTDEFGNIVTREYLMTTGYLWTGQFEECQVAVTEGRPQSMELDEETIDGHWSTDQKTGMDFFIINDAIFSKLCILGEDVEPCFEGSRITTPEVSTSFTVDDNFKNTLFSMMKELKFALEGGQNMDLEENIKVEAEENVIVEEENVAAEEEEIITEEKTETETNEEVETEVENTEVETETEEEVEVEENTTIDEEPVAATEESNTLDYSLLEEQYEQLKVQYAAKEQECEELKAYKLSVENEKKDALIASFYMLSDEDKAEIKANKEKYSYDDIEAKLCVLCYKNKVNFDLDNSDKNENNIETEEPVTTFNMDYTETSLPAWINAVKNTRDSRK